MLIGEPTELDGFSFFLCVLGSVSLGTFAKTGLMLCDWSMIHILKIVLERRSEFSPFFPVISFYEYCLM